MYKSSIFKSRDSLDINCYQVGFEKCNKFHHYGPVARGLYLFHYIVEGEGTFIYRDSNNNDVNVNLKKGNGFLISPYQVTTYFTHGKNPWSYYWIELDGIQVKKIFKTMGLEYDSPVFTSKEHLDFKKTESVFREFLQRSNESNELFVLGQTYSILSMLLEDSATAINNKSNVKHVVVAVIDYIKENYASITNTQEICDYFQLSNNHLSNLFKKEYGMTLNRFFSEFKMRKAQQLLINSDISISELAELLNYSNQFNFSRAFKNEFGHSPNQWRELNRN